jgi:hypothetical protein
MILPTKTGGVVATAAACLVASALAACAGTTRREVAADRPPSLRVMVQLVHASEDAAAIGAEASRIAGVPVDHAAATSTTWHALALHCAGAECDAAIARLRAAGAVYRAVEIEGRKVPAAS